MFFVIISISIYNFGIYLILVLSNCNAIQSTDCHVRYFNKLSISSISNGLGNFFPSERNSKAMAAINKAMELWRTQTCVRFKKRTNENAYVYVHIGSG